MKTCETCRWLSEGWVCRRSFEGLPPYPSSVTARYNRNDKENDLNCGPSGRYWEPREEGE